MTTHARQVATVILAVTTCLGVGLWMHHRLVRSSILAAAEVRAYEHLERYLVDYVRGSPTALPLVPSAPDVHLTQVDRQFRVTESDAVGRETRRPSLPRGKPVAWRSNGQTGAANLERGVLETPGDTQLAVARTRPGGDGFVLVHRSQGAVHAEAEALLGSLPMIGGLLLVWTTALVALVVYMILARFHDQLKRQRERAAAEERHQRQQLIRTRDAVIFGLAKLADSRDPETGDHLERISAYSTALASALRRHPKYRDRVTPAFVRLIGISSALHDIGKVGVEDRILRKPDALTDEERLLMQRHATMGGDCLREIEQRLGSSNFLQMAREIACHHHEHWDGSGYPRGLRGEEIPLAARIVAIADVYDALYSRRAYKEPFAHEECVAMIREGAGRQFDPDLVAIWMTVSSRFAELARRYADGEVPREAYWLEESVEAEDEKPEEAPASSAGPSHAAARH